MADGESLADRMRRLGEGDADAKEEAAAIERAQKEKASLADRLREQAAHQEESTQHAHEPSPQDGLPGSEATTSESEERPPTGTEGGRTADRSGESLAAHMRRIEGQDSDGGDELAAVQRAMESKKSLAARMEALQGSGVDDVEEPDVHEGHIPAPTVEGQDTRRKRVTDWFMGRFTQEHSDEAITPIPDLPDGWEEIQLDEVEPPYSFVRIRRNGENGEMLYEVLEPPLDEGQEQILAFIQDALVRGLNVDPENLDRMDRAEILERAVRQIIHDYRIRITDVGQERVMYYIKRDFIGLGPIQAVMVDPGIEDVSCDGPREGLFVFHRVHESIPSNIVFASAADLDAFVIRLAQRSGKSISISDPILDAALPDGSRLQATLGQEVTENGSTFTIRRFKPDPFTPVDLVRFGSMSLELLAYFWLIVENGSSLIFSGGTASGKTTGLNAISQFIPPQAKIVSIEDTREVNLPHKNWIKSVTRTGSSTEGTGEIGMFELLKASLRQRPEYILVGEVRGIEASVAFQAMATGHTVYSTMHADSARSVVYRLENDPINVPRLVLQALDVIAIQGQVRYKGQRVRRVQEVVELVGMDPQTRELLTHTVFTWNNVDDTFHYAGRSYMLDGIADARNWDQAKADQEFKDRTRVIKWMIDTERTAMSRVTTVIHEYYRNKDSVMELVEKHERGETESKEEGARHDA